MQTWEQQRGEGQKLYDAFKCYLACRNVEKVAKQLNKSKNYIQRICSEWNWKSRAANFDKSLLEEMRQELKRELVQIFKAQWLECTELRQAAISALRQKDLRTASFKSLNEIYHSAAQLQMKIVDQLSLLVDSGDDDKNLTINIVQASKKGSGNDDKF